MKNFFAILLIALMALSLTSCFGPSLFDDGPYYGYHSSSYHHHTPPPPSPHHHGHGHGHGW